MTLIDEKYLKFKIGQQANFLRLTKKNSFNSWDKMANFLGINRSMIFLYLNEQCKLPLNKARKLCLKSKTNIDLFKFKIVHYPIYGTARLPQKQFFELAEFVGILIGDGSINHKTNQIIISSGEIDGDYIKKYIPNLINRLFSKKVKFRKLSKGGLDCLFSSKLISTFLTKKMGFVSPKTNISIPKIFFSNTNLLKACIKGLFDTDGGIHRHHKKSIQLKFTNKSKPLIFSLQRALSILGYKVTNTIDKRNHIYSLYLFGKTVEKYSHEIGFSNPKNQIKFKQWISTGFVPLNSELKSI